MMTRELIQALAFSAPFVCALVCLVMLLLDILITKKNKKEKHLQLFMSVTFIVIMLTWLGLVFKVAFHSAFVCYFSIFLLTMMLNQILIYCFIHILTTIGRKDRVSHLHLVVPLLLMTISIVADVTVDLQQKEAIIYGDGKGNSLFSILYLLTGVAAIIYYTFYPVLGYLRIRRYRRSIENYSADSQRNSLNWLVFLQIISLILIPVPFTGLLYNADFFSDIIFSVQGSLLAFISYPILCYNLLSDNYVIISPEDEDMPDNNALEIDPRRFTQYMREKTPYLNPHLRITHVAADLHTNRNYVSSFINRVYGMNFSRFINRYRLKELHRLRLSPEHKGNTNLELVLSAGFSSYRSYLRAKNEENKANLLKEF